MMRSAFRFVAHVGAMAACWLGMILVIVSAEAASAVVALPSSDVCLSAYPSRGCLELVGAAGWGAFFALLVLCGIFIERLHSLLFGKSKD